MAEGGSSREERSFLAEVELRPFRLDSGRGLQPVGLALGQGGGALEVAVTQAARKPAQATMRAVWKARHGGRAVPLLLVALYDDKAALCGPSGDEPPVYLDHDVDQVERLCLAALAEPDRHAAARFLKSVVPEIESPLPGLRNEGLFATHELSHGVPARRDWPTAQQRAAGLLGLRGRQLLEALGYQIEEVPGQASILRVGQRKTAVAIFLDRHEATDVASARFGGVSPISYALAKADAESLPYVFVNHGPALRIYPTVTGVGTGRRGRTETFIEVHLDLLPAERAAYLWLLFSGEALVKGGTFADILARSSDYAADLGKRLRERVYGFIVPELAMAIVEGRALKKPTAQDLAVTYEMTLTVLFRLLFIAYAEDKELLPYRTNDLYRRRSLKEKARDLAKMKQNAHGDLAAWQAMFDDSTSHWADFTALRRAVNEGKPKEWGVPPYNGGLFSEDPKVSQVGAFLVGISIPNKAFGPILTELLVDVGEPGEGFGPVDFRSLGVREFGTIYEGLLESELSVAETDLVGDAGELYEPAGDRPPNVRKGRVYLHNASGARKSTGSYYTKDFAVEHLLDHALEPALDEHLARLGKMEDRKAGEAFFDFRVADIAMGSGHFLVSAVDRIERKLSSYLTGRQLPDVVNELARLKAAACEALGVPADVAGIEDTQLLRRQIARRCIYGVDLNPVAVDLARLSLWIHTFVPGLPLSFLDRNVVRGNSLVGIATLSEAAEMFGVADQPLYQDELRKLIDPARDALSGLAKLSDADAKQVRQAREAWLKAELSLAVARTMFDILTASRLPQMGPPPDLRDFQERGQRDIAKLHAEATEALKDAPPFHFPVAFPEVFLRDRAGFDVILGNPPWKEATVEEDRFWNRYVPGLQAMPQHEQEKVKGLWRQDRPDLLREYETELAKANALRQLLVHGPFPGMGTGDPDVYKAFAWRFWHLTTPDAGRIGVVLPRSALSAKGSSSLRTEVLRNASLSACYLINSAGWVFDDAEWRYTIGLVVLDRSSRRGADVALKGPFRSLDRYLAAMDQPFVTFPASEVLSWTDTAALPVLPADESAQVFAQLRKAPRLDLNEDDQWRARPHTELHATNDKHRMELVEKKPRGYWPVFKGESFDIWEPDRGPGTYYAWAEPRRLLEHLTAKRHRGRTRSNSVWFEFAHRPTAWFNSEKTLPCFAPRIAFKDLVRNTDSRTMKVGLIPPHVFATNKAPFFLWPRGGARDQAYLLGVLSSVPLDWYARRFVELGMNYHILNAFPIPRPGRDDPLWQRVVQLAGRLACPDDRFAEWASAVGVECGPIPEPNKEEMIFELDLKQANRGGRVGPRRAGARGADRMPWPAAA